MAIRKNSAIMDLMNGIDMRLGYVGYAAVDSSWKTDSLATPFNRLYLIESGTGRLSAGNEELILSPGKAYLLPAGLPCSYNCDGSLSLLFFHFNLTKQNKYDLMQEIGYPAVVQFPEEELVELRMFCESTSYTDAFEVICSLNSIVLKMKRKYQFHWNDPPVYSDCVEHTISFINKHLSGQLRIEELAKQCFISESYLSRKFKAEVGITIKQYIHMQLINAAQWQLSNTDAGVEKISIDLGFCNQFYFSEWFKRHCRVSPLQYRHGTKY